ncbi:NUDIX hydrolase [Macrococcus animalis]|uniref:NUDIX hydrolase n=1 Tax=Macrococcus animalis TaxID=3395467 RepID=UPI0039BDAB83
MEYIKAIRKKIGHDCLIVIGAGVLIEMDDKLLLEQRQDNGQWGIPGGLIEIGEKVSETAKREVFEETGLKLNKLDLFGIYSGEEYFVKYPNNDEIYGINIVFKSHNFNGELQMSCESMQLKFFNKEEIKKLKLNHSHSHFITDWINGETRIHID